MNYYLMGGMVVASIALIVYSLWPNDEENESTIKRRMSGRKSEEKTVDARAQARESVAQRVVEKFAPIAIMPSATRNADQMSKLRTKLAMGGFRSEAAPTTFLASKTIVAILAGIIVASFVLMKGLPFMTAVGYIMIAGGVGFLAPDFWLGSAISKRKVQIQQALPDTLDTLVISVEAGLGLDGALLRVGEELHHVHPVLAEELQLITLETQMGIPRSEAMGNFATRVGLDEVKSFVAIVNQAERFGSSIARALRNQSDVLRVKRRQRAEEKAQKTAVKLMAPLILFIFPAIMVVLAGPAALKMIEALNNTPGLL